MERPRPSTVIFICLPDIILETASFTIVAVFSPSGVVFRERIISLSFVFFDSDFESFAINDEILCNNSLKRILFSGSLSSTGTEPPRMK